MKYKDYFLISISIVALFFFVKLCNKKTEYIDRETVIEKHDTIIKYETITVEKPKLIYQRVIDSIAYMVEVPKIDSIITIQLPKSQYYYEDSCYQAWVTGFECTLDSLKYEKEIIEVTHTIEKTIEHWQKYGIMAGLELSSNFNNRLGLSPQLGAEIKGNVIILGYDILNKEAQIKYLYKFYKK